MAAPTFQADIVVIGDTVNGASDGTYGTPRNYYKAHDHKVVLTYSGGDLVQVDEIMKDGGETLRKRTTLTYSGGDLSTVNTKVYALDGVAMRYEWIDTMVYDNGDLIRVERTVI